MIALFVVIAQKKSHVGVITGGKRYQTDIFILLMPQKMKSGLLKRTVISLKLYKKSKTINICDLNLQY